MSNSIIIFQILLFVLIVLFPFIIDNLMKEMSYQKQINSVKYNIYFSALIFAICLCCIPFMIILDAPNLLFINLITLPSLPWLITGRYQAISKKYDGIHYIYFFIFELLLVFLFISLLLITSTKI